MCRGMSSAHASGSMDLFKSSKVLNNDARYTACQIPMGLASVPSLDSCRKHYQG